MQTGAGASTISETSRRRGALRTVNAIDIDIAAALNALPRLRAERKLAKASELRDQLSAVERDYRAGVDREKIQKDHSVSAGQVAGWAHRLGWSRPIERVQDLAPSQVTVYRDLRDGRTKAAAVRLASEANPIKVPARTMSWGGRRGCGAQSARLSGAPTTNRSPVRNQAPDRHARVRALSSSAGERS